MKVQILVSKWCPVCPQAEAVWKQAAEKVPMELQVLDVADREGREIVSNLRIKTVPAIVVDNEGNETEVLFTRAQLKEARERAVMNPEDFPEKTLWEHFFGR